MALKKDAKTDENKQTKDVKTKAETEAATDETKAVAAKEPKKAIGTYIYCGPAVKKYGIGPMQYTEAQKQMCLSI